MNTSYNTRGRPIINLVSESLQLMMSESTLDHVVIEGWLFSRKKIMAAAQRNPALGTFSAMRLGSETESADFKQSPNANLGGGGDGGGDGGGGGGDKAAKKAAKLAAKKLKRHTRVSSKRSKSTSSKSKRGM
jgi:hypothetical protein